MGAGESFLSKAGLGITIEGSSCFSSMLGDENDSEPLASGTGERGTPLREVDKVGVAEARSTGFLGANFGVFKSVVKAAGKVVVVVDGVVVSVFLGAITIVTGATTLLTSMGGTRGATKTSFVCGSSSPSPVTASAY